MPAEISNTRILPKSILILSSLFIVLSLSHYFSSRPLWQDEAAVLESIQQLDYNQIFGTLNRAQAFPRVHLVAIKFLNSILGQDVKILRFLSLIFMVSGFFLWKRIYTLNSRSLGIAVWGVLAFCASYQMSYYAAELKSYSADVFCIGIYVLFLGSQQHFEEKTPNLNFYFGMIGLPLLMFISYAVLFVAWIPAYNTLLMTRRNKSLWLPFFLNIVVTAAAFTLLYHIDLKFGITHPALVNYWEGHFLAPGIGQFFSQLTEGIKGMATWYYGGSKIWRQAAIPLIPVFVYSIGYLGWKDLKHSHGKINRPAGTFVAVFLTLILAGILKKYPFTAERVTLFLAPFVFYIMAEGVDSCKKIKFIYWPYTIFYLGYLTTCLFYTVYLRTAMLLGVHS